jgi:hypothetical protein
MEDSEFLAISTLFDAIGVIEKGIEKIYHYLLTNKRIENLKDVSNQFGLSLKRGYKICSVLNELELVQIYDRPMKIILSTPVLSLWQKIVSDRIEDLVQQFQEKKQKAEEALKDFSKSYNLSEEVPQEFVEFINYDLTNFAETYSAFQAKSMCKIAIGIRYENDLIISLKKYGLEKLPTTFKDAMKDGMLKLNNNLKNLDIQAIFNVELAKELLLSEEFKILTSHIETYGLKFKNVDVHVTYDDFSNFIITDNELIQPSFDPSNKLIGSYLSRNTSIYQIFYDKFNELFEKGIPINQFIKQQEDLNIRELNDIQSFILCIL